MDKFTIRQIQRNIESINLSMEALHKTVKTFILQTCRYSEEKVIDIKELGYKYQPYINGKKIVYSVGYIAVNENGDIYLMDYHLHNHLFLCELPLQEQAALLEKLTTSFQVNVV